MGKNALTKRQVSFLRGLGQQLKPALRVGQEGHTPATQRALEELFAHRELVKVRVLPNAAVSARDTAQAMAGEAEAHLVGVVGHTFVLYRPNPKLKERIRLDE